MPSKHLEEPAQQVDACDLPAARAYRCSFDEGDRQVGSSRGLCVLHLDACQGHGAEIAVQCRTPQVSSFSGSARRKEQGEPAEAADPNHGAADFARVGQWGQSHALRQGEERGEVSRAACEAGRHQQYAVCESQRPLAIPLRHGSIPSCP